MLVNKHSILTKVAVPRKKQWSGQTQEVCRLPTTARTLLGVAWSHCSTVGQAGQG